MLSLALDNKLEINTTLLPNIGYQWNERLHNPLPNPTPWIGQQYLCFSRTGGPETFIYTKNGILYIEIIPLYTSHRKNTRKHIQQVSFKQFLKQYKPYLCTTINNKTAHHWLAIAQHLRNIIDTNESHRS